MEGFPVRDDQVQKATQINEGPCVMARVYCGIFWTLQRPATELCGIIDKTISFTAGVNKAAAHIDNYNLSI
jgi:hypothetical protein